MTSTWSPASSISPAASTRVSPGSTTCVTPTTRGLRARSGRGISPSSAAGTESRTLSIAGHDGDPGGAHVLWGVIAGGSLAIGSSQSGRWVIAVVLRLLCSAAAAWCALLLAAGGAQAHPRHGSAAPDLGPNVKVFDPSMPTSQIQATVDAIAAQQVSNQFGTQRYALLFKPGTYGSATQPLIFQVGYYSEVAGLGSSPRDVTINGAIDVRNQCDASGCTALDNFWRSMSNLTINITGQTGCRSKTEFWAVSQAAPLRRVAVTGGNVSLMDYCTAGPQYASGGFIADSAFSGTVTNGSQQQFFVRNSSFAGWSNGVWNQVFAGDVGAPPQSFPTPPYTTLPTTPRSREKPFLYVDPRGGLRVFVPSAQTNSQGTTWAT